MLSDIFPLFSPRNLLGWYFKVYSVKMPFGWLGGSHSKVRESRVGLTIFKEDGALGTYKENMESMQRFLNVLKCFKMTYFTMFTIHQDFCFS